MPWSEITYGRAKFITWDWLKFIGRDGLWTAKKNICGVLRKDAHKILDFLIPLDLLPIWVSENSQNSVKIREISIKNHFANTSTVGIKPSGASILWFWRGMDVLYERVQIVFLLADWKCYIIRVCRYVTFVLFPRHTNPTNRDNTINLIHQFRTYLHYHIKCSKAYLHSRMRSKTSEFLKVMFST